MFHDDISSNLRRATVRIAEGYDPGRDRYRKIEFNKQLPCKHCGILTSHRKVDWDDQGELREHIICIECVVKIRKFKQKFLPLKR